MQVFKTRSQIKLLSAIFLTSGFMLASPQAYAETSSVKIGALVAGQVSNVFVKEGQTVKKGQKLLNLDASRYQAKLALFKAQANLAKANLDDAKIELDQALDLYDRTVTSKRSLDASQLRFDIAKATYDKAQAELALQKSWSKYVYIKSPINAKVLKILTPIGSTVYKENTPMIELQP